MGLMVLEPTTPQLDSACSSRRPTFVRAPKARPTHVNLCGGVRVLKQPANVTAAGGSDAISAQATIKLPASAMPSVVVGDRKERPLQDPARSSAASTPSSKSGEHGFGAYEWVPTDWLACGQ
jgi:hypothetical protein